MKKVYILQTGHHDRKSDSFVFYEVDVFSSIKKLDASIVNRIFVNKGYALDRQELDCISDTKYGMITYKCLSTDGREMQVRYLVKTREVQ